MSQMNLRGVDLNLLVVLNVLLQERHVSRTAEQLGMSQPAVSRALQRLRATFDDPLLVKMPQGFDLSARAEQLQPQLVQMLGIAGRLVSGPDFDPLSSRDTVCIFAPDPDVVWFLPALFKRMRQLAPGMVLDVRSDPRDHFELLASGEAHFAISPFQPSTSTGQLRSSTLSEVEFAIVMSGDNPLAKGRLTIERYLKASHAMISLTGRGGSIVEQELRDKGILPRDQALNIPLRLTSFTALAAFCESSDLLLHLPRHFAEEIARGRNLLVREVLPELKKPKAEISLYWHERFHRDPMCRWIRQQIKKIHVSPTLAE